MLEDDVLEFFGGEQAIRERIRVVSMAKLAELSDETKTEIEKVWGIPQAVINGQRAPTISEFNDLDFYFSEGALGIIFPKKELSPEEFVNWGINLSNAGVRTLGSQRVHFPNLYQDMTAVAIRTLRERESYQG